MADGVIIAEFSEGKIPGLTVDYPLIRQRPPTANLAADGAAMSAGSIDRAAPLVENYRTLSGFNLGSFFSDYYNTVYMIPGSVNFGSVTATMQITFYVWNAHLTSQTLNSIDEDSVQGLSLAGAALPTTFKRIEHKAYTITAGTDGPAYINGKYTFNFNNDHVSLLVFGSRAELWRLPPNWSDRYEITYGFLTDIVTSRSGREQRRALRKTPRKSIEFQAIAHADGLRWLNTVMGGWQKNGFLMPELTRDARTTSAMGAGSPSVLIDAVPAWLTVGASVVLNDRGRFATYLVDAIDGNSVAFAGGVSEAWPIDSRIHPGLSGLITSSLQTSRLTSDVSTVPASFSATPGLEMFPDPPAPDVTWSTDGTEVMLVKPDFGTAPGVTYAWPVENIDYNAGVIATYGPVRFGTRTWQATYQGATRDRVQAILDVFMRAKGRRGEFYMPTWENDVPPMDDLTSGSFRLRTKGSDLANLMNGNAVYRNIIAFTFDGRYFMNRVSRIDPVVDERGSDSVLTLATAWPQAIPVSTLVKVCWMPRWRFASDSLVVSWLTDQVATITTAMSTLEDLS